jgi:glycosyltransferase involved in cell wall biosynthesis
MALLEVEIDRNGEEKLSARAAHGKHRLRIFMMDLWATVPYYTAYLSKALRDCDVDVMVGSISYYLDLDCFRGRGIKVDPGMLDVVGRFQMPPIPRRILKMIEALINQAALVVRFAVAAPDIVHVQYLPMLKWRIPIDVWFLRYCKMRGAKIVLTVHDLLPHDSGEKFKRTFNVLYSFVDGIICHSDHVAGRLETEFGVPSMKVSVIPHGPFFYDMPVGEGRRCLDAVGVPSGATVVLWQGIIFPYKGVDLLLDAWKRVEAEKTEAYLVIVGTGSAELLAEIRGQVAQLNLQHVKLHFSFVSVSELVDLYRGAEVVVYPYRAITTSGALATGLALGKAIIASDLPVFRELLENDTNALLVNAENSDELSSAILRMVGDAELRRRLSDAVRALDYGDRSWSAIAEKTVAAYDLRLMKETRGA